MTLPLDKPVPNWFQVKPLSRLIWTPLPSVPAYRRWIALPRDRRAAKLVMTRPLGMPLLIAVQVVAVTLYAPPAVVGSVGFPLPAKTMVESAMRVLIQPPSSPLLESTQGAAGVVAGTSLETTVPPAFVTWSW